MANLSNEIPILNKGCREQLWALMALILTFGPLSMDAMEQEVYNMDGVLKLKTDAPAILDAPITVTAVLSNAEDFKPPFYFSFSKLRKYRLILAIDWLRDLLNYGFWGFADQDI